MARRAEGWRLTLDGRTGVYGVRWRASGVRHHVTTGERDPGAATAAAARIYAEAVSGRRRVTRAAGGRAPLDEAAAEWLADADALDEETGRKYEQYAAAWAEFFGSLGGLTGPAIEDYWRARLRVVKRRTVVKSLYALNTFLRWCRARGLIGEIPAYDMPAKSSTGTPSTGRRVVETVPLSEKEVDALIGHLPERSEKARKGTRGETGRHHIRDRFRVAWETALRPATLDAIRAPGDYRRGAATLKIRDEIDKARFGREVPLSGRARDALDRCCPDVGPIFGRLDSHTASDYLRAAAVAAKLDARKAEAIKPYDLRHARLTFLAEHAENLVGVAFLAGHLALTTTNRYVHAHARAAAEVLAQVAIGTGDGTGGRARKREGAGRAR